MKNYLSIGFVFCFMVIGLMGCPPAPVSPNLLVTAMLSDDHGQEFWSGEMQNFDQIMIENGEGPIYGNIRYSGENLKKIRISFSIDEEIISLDIFNSAKTYENEDLWGYLIAIGVVNALHDFEFSSGTDESGVVFNALDFYLSEIVDSMTVAATTNSDTAFMVTFAREGSAVEDNYLLLTESLPVEGGAVTGSGTYSAGTDATITATPASGWTFDHWVVNGTMAYNNPGTITMDSDVNVIAVFVRDTVADYTLSMTTTGQGTTTGAGSYAMGTEVTITATPASGWIFDHWTVNGTIAHNNPGTITMDSDVTVVAVFTQNTPTNYTLTITTEGQGTTTGAGSYAIGTEVTITATPASGWTFDHWTVNGTIAHNNPGIVTMDGDVTVVAVFTQNTPTNYTLTITTEGQGTTTGAGSYAMGTEVTITATPASGWTFDHWVVNGTIAHNNPGIVTMDGNVTVIAVFSGDANPGGLIKVDLTWNGSTLVLDAENANPGHIGLELYHQSGGTPWIERQVFTVDNGNAYGTINKFRPNVLRFSVVSEATSGGYIPLDTLTVKINGQNVPLVDQNGNSAFQVDVSTL